MGEFLFGAIGWMARLPTSLLVAWSVIAATLVILVIDFNLDGGRGAEIGPQTLNTSWTSDRPGWSSVFEKPVGLRGSDLRALGHAGGMFTVRVPFGSEKDYEVFLFMLNADQVAKRFRAFLICLQVTAAAVQRNEAVESRSSFLEAAENASLPCKVLSPSTATFREILNLDQGVVLDRMDRLPSHPEFDGPRWLGFNIGVVDGTLTIREGSEPVEPRFVLDVIPF